MIICEGNLESTDEILIKRVEKLKTNFENALKLFENKIAENLSKKSKSDNSKFELSEVKTYLEETEKSLQELKSMLKP